MDTPKKRTHSDVDIGSSPEQSEKRANMGDQPDDLKFIREALASLQADVALSTKVGQETQTTVNEVKSTLDTLVDRVSDVETKVKDNSQAVTTCKQDVNRIGLENQLLRRQVRALEEKSIKAEAYSRRQNLLFDGIPVSENENVEQKVREILQTKLKCDRAQEIPFVRVHRLGKMKKVILKFEHFKDRQNIWEQRRELKNSNIWMEEDYPAEIRNRRQVLLPILKCARDMPEINKAFLVEDRLVINGHTYTIESLYMLPPALKLHNTSLVFQDNNVYFYTRSSPLSNFFPAKFKVAGVEFNCVEQFYQVSKAENAGDTATAEEILCATDPARMHFLGKNVKVDPNRWTEGKQKQVMEQALNAKFNDNKFLQDVLRATGEKQLVEASPHDTFWGAGLGMRDIQRTPEAAWPGQNTLGKLIMEVRRSLP